MKILEFLKRFWANTRGEPSSAVDVVYLAISVLLLAYLLPIGIGAIYAANTTGWDVGVKAIFTILFPILAVVISAMRLLKDVSA